MMRSSLRRGGRSMVPASAGSLETAVVLGDPVGDLVRRSEDVAPGSVPAELGGGAGAARRLTSRYPSRSCG